MGSNNFGYGPPTGIRMCTVSVHWHVAKDESYLPQKEKTKCHYSFVLPTCPT